MPPLMALPPGTRFRQPELGLTGTLLKVNECRALVRIDQPQQLVEFTGPDGSIRTFQARRQHETSWTPAVVVEVLSISDFPERDTTMTKTKTAKTATTKATKAKGTKATEPKKAAAKKAVSAEKRMSILDAAAKVLGESKEPLACKAMIEAMGAKGYWSSPAGKTPAATLYAAILREINTKGTDSRFQKRDRGLFALAGATVTKAEPKAKGKKAAKTEKPADGTPGPKAVAELFNI